MNDGLVVRAEEALWDVRLVDVCSVMLMVVEDTHQVGLVIDGDGKGY